MAVEHDAAIMMPRQHFEIDREVGRTAGSPSKVVMERRRHVYVRVPFCIAVGKYEWIFIPMGTNVDDAFRSLLKHYQPRDRDQMREALREIATRPDLQAGARVISIARAALNLDL